MERSDVEARLAEVGLADTAVATGATIRATSSETLAAPLPAAVARALPRLSIDLRGWLEGVAPKASLSEADLEVEGVLGEGGMGRVLLARQHSLRRDVALKTPKDASDPATRASLLAEGATTGMLEHPAIVPVHALGLDATGQPAMVMKRIEGVAWSALAADPSHPGWEGWSGSAEDRLPGHLQILVQVCNAAHYAHSREVVHRDIKLDNVLIGRFGDVYLADWGVAGAVGERSARLSGTPGYMAPEMVTGGVVDARTDVYLLGATLHEILTGEMRHEAPHVASALLHAAQSRPHEYPASVPRGLAELVNRACHADPEERFSTATALRHAITEHLDHRESAALAADARERLGRLEALLATEEALDEDGQAEVARLVAEARFGFDRALARWVGDDETHEARDRLETIVRQRAERAAALERLARDRDPGVGARARAIFLVGLGLLGIGTTAYALYQGTVDVTPAQLVVLPAILFAGLVVGTLGLRRQLLATTFGRQTSWMLWVVMALLVVERLVGLAAPTPPEVHFARDSLMIAAAFLASAMGYGWWLLAIGIGFLGAFFVGAFLPEHGRTAFTLAGSLAMFIGARAQLVIARDDA